jgi:hypothetical protein
MAQPVAFSAHEADKLLSRGGRLDRVMANDLIEFDY